MSCRKEKEKLIEENQQLSTALCDLRNIFLNQEAKIKQLADVVNSFSSNFGLNKITKTFNANDFVRFLNRIVCIYISLLILMKTIFRMKRSINTRLLKAATWHVRTKEKFAHPILPNLELVSFFFKYMNNI
jgi:hypothetical protein